MKYTDFFNDILLLKEYTKEVLPGIFSALEKESDPMIGVHFSHGIRDFNPSGKATGKYIPHLGLNVQPGHNDPLGLYVFPKKYVLSGGLKRNQGFYSSSDWYIIEPIRSKCKILNLSKITNDELPKLLDKMGISNEYLTDPTVFHKSSVVDLEDNAGHKLWGIMEKFIHQGFKSNYNKSKNAINEGIGQNVEWNKLFKKAGINVLIDEGSSIIHSNEPSQIVYMEAGTYNVVSRGKNDQGKYIVSGLIKKIMSDTPGYRMSKKKSGWDNSGTVMSLTNVNHPGEQIIIDYSPNQNRLHVTIYGFKNEFKEGYYIDSEHYKFDLDSIAKDIREFTKTEARSNWRIDAQSEPMYSVLKNITEYYGMSPPNTETPQFYRKLFFDKNKNMKVKLEFYVSGDRIVMSIERNKPYSSYNYFFNNQEDWNQEPNDPASIMSRLFDGMVNTINKQKPYGDNWAFEINVKDALKTVDFLRRRVFVPRNKKTISKVT